MPEFKMTITIKTTVTAASEEALREDLKRLSAKKSELEKIVQEWLNERP